MTIAANQSNVNQGKRGNQPLIDASGVLHQGSGVCDGPVELADSNFRRGRDFAIHVERSSRATWLESCFWSNTIEERTRCPHRVPACGASLDSGIAQIVKYEVQSLVLMGKAMDFRAHRFGAEFEGVKDGIHTSYLS
jgi:hypothetical protein